MKASEVLRKAKGLIDKPEKWSHAWEPGGPHKGFYCMGCAVYNAADMPKGLAYQSVPAYLVLERAIGGSVIEFNQHPTTTHAEVMQAFDRAIALAEKEEQINAAPQVNNVANATDGRRHAEYEANAGMSVSVLGSPSAVAAPDAAFQRFMESLTTGTLEDVATAK